LADPLKQSFDPLDPAPPVPAPGGIAARARAAAPGSAAYLAGLNTEQRLAVETLDGPVLVLAGAGTGKTRVLTVRIAHILSLGRAWPGEILAVTFTNKAAREMKGRVGEIVGQVVEGMPWLGTFHSIGVKILRRHAELVGLKSDFTILDVDDQIRLLKQLLDAENIDEKRWPARVLAMLIDGWKNRGLTCRVKVTGREAGSVSAQRLARSSFSWRRSLKQVEILPVLPLADLLLEAREFGLLDMDEIVDETGTEGGAQRLVFPQRLERLAERPRQGGCSGFVRGVGRRARIERGVDAVEPEC